MRGEERDRLVAPVVHLAGRTILRVELEHGKELNGGNPELLQIRDFLDYTSVGAAFGFIDSRAGMARKSSNVHLVDNRPRRELLEWRITVPIIAGRIDHHALHCGCAGVAGAAGCAALICVW